MKDLIIDCFAGGGGASVGIEMALGRPVDIAINHDPDAILMHKTNHPNTLPELSLLLTDTSEIPNRFENSA